MQSNVLNRSLNGNDFHIGVGSDVVCSTIIGNARASTRGMDNRTIPRFFVSMKHGSELDSYLDMRIGTKPRGEESLLYNVYYIVLPNSLKHNSFETFLWRYGKCAYYFSAYSIYFNDG